MLNNPQTYSTKIYNLTLNGSPTNAYSKKKTGNTLKTVINALAGIRLDM
jgi:hypothetical protein